MLNDADREAIFQRLAAFIDAAPESETAERLARLCLALALRCDSLATVEGALRSAEQGASKPPHGEEPSGA